MSKIFDLGAVIGPVGPPGPRGPMGPPGDVPEEGTPGQVLTKMEEGHAWADLALSSITTSANNAQIEAMLTASKFCYLHAGGYYLPLIWRKSATEHYFGGYVFNNVTSKPVMVTYRCVSDVWTGEVKDDTAFLNSPAFTGTPTAPTASSGTDNTQIATTAFVQQAFEDNAIMVDGILEGDGAGNIDAAEVISSTEIDAIIGHITPAIVPDTPYGDWVLIAVPVISPYEIDAIINSLS